MRKALQAVEERADDIVEEWISLVEIPAPSGKERAHTDYIRGEMQKLGLSDIRTDDMLKVSGVLGIPGVAVGVVTERMPHRLEESAGASSIVPGIKSLIALEVALTTHSTTPTRARIESSSLGAVRS